MGSVFYDKLKFFFLNSFAPLMVGRFPKRKYNEIFYDFVYYFHVLRIFFLAKIYVFAPHFCFLSH